MIRFAPPSSVTLQMLADAACSAAFDVLLNAAVPEASARVVMPARLDSDRRRSAAQAWYGCCMQAVLPEQALAAPSDG